MVDRFLLESLGPLGLVRFFKNLIKKVSLLQSGLIYHYVFCIMLGLLFLLSFIFFNVEMNLSLFLVLLGLIVLNLITN